MDTVKCSTLLVKLNESDLISEYSVRYVDVYMQQKLTYQEVFLKNGNFGKAARKDERAMETKRESIYDLGYVAIAMFCHQPKQFLGNLLMITT